MFVIGVAMSSVMMALVMWSPNAIATIGIAAPTGFLVAWAMDRLSVERETTIQQSRVMQLHINGVIKRAVN